MVSMVSPVAWTIPFESWSTICKPELVIVMTKKDPSTGFVKPSAARVKAVGVHLISPVINWRQKMISMANTAIPNSRL